MAAKKTNPQSASPKGTAKPDVKPAKPAPAAKKPVAKAASKPADAKPAAAKKPEPEKKDAAAKKAPVAAKPAAAPVKKAAAPVKAEKPAEKPAAVAEAKPAKPAKSEAPAKAPSKPRSSLVDFPVPPAPVKPPFVPPKAAPAPVGEPVAAGSNGTHSPAFVQKQRQRLLDLRDELVDAMSGMTRDTIRNAPEGSEASGSGQHQGDAGSDAYDRDFALSVLAKEQDALYEIEKALRRIQSGSYGICEISSRKIPQARLEAIPFARLTVECQAQWEKEYGKRRFRPSNEVGFSGGKYVEDEDSETVSLDEDED
ncbi:MAG: TraR/DksA family transcriptional regulator [Akkermansiaceae bacterium]|nr:TraR/DksA family transcriptional regulator [Akkermansiaceae bacterium]